MSAKATKILRDDSAGCEQLAATLPKRHWLILPPDVRKWGQALLHQQCWCWGQDIKRREGNLLLEQGFCRTRAPEGHRGSPTYHKRLSEDHSVTLWGFGMLYAEPGRGGVFLSRSGFAPRYSPRPEPSRQAWKAEHLSDFAAPSTPRQCCESLCLLCAALRWLAEYEAHVLREHSAGYRAATLRQWDSHAVLEPHEVPAEWRRLSELCQRRAAICTRDASGLRRALAHEFIHQHSAS